MSRVLATLACLCVLAGTGRAQEPSPEPSPPAAEPSPPQVEPPPAPEPTPPPAPPPSAKVFNPDLAVVGNFIGALGENEVDPRPALDLDEVELSLQAIVDPFARADFFLTFGPEEVGVEEGYITFTSLPAGLLARAGKFKASFGKVNTQHPHQLPWIDRPLPVLNLLGGEEGFNDAGLSVSRLFPNPALFLEVTAEVFRGQSEGLFTAPRRQDVTLLGRLRAYRDLSESANLDLGGSIARGVNDHGSGFHTTLVGADLSLRWRPLRRAIYRRLLLRGELFWSRRQQAEGTTDPAVTEDGTQGGGPGRATARAFGYYAAAEYQFARRWFAGARYDAAERADEPALRDRSGSLLLTFWPSEFSQVRGQLRRTSYAEGPQATELLLQLLFSIGAHGAHAF